jgi:phage-related protein
LLSTAPLPARSRSGTGCGGCRPRIAEQSTDLATVQVGWPVGMPLCRSLGAGLWEVRSKLSNGRIARLLLFFAGDRIGVVHGFIKKTQKTPPAELDLAAKRMKEMLR